MPVRKSEPDSAGVTGDGEIVQGLEQKQAPPDEEVVILDKSDSAGDQWELEEKPKMGEKEKAIHALESAKTAITDADEDGYDTETAKNLFRQARPLYESADFLGVIDKIREVEREILRIKGHSENEIEEILGESSETRPSSDGPMSNDERNELNEAINKVWVKFKEAERYKLDTADYKTRLEHAKSRRTYSEARRIVDEVNGELTKVVSDFESEQHSIASNKFHQVRSEILGAHKHGIDVQPFNEMLDTASSAISRSNYEYAMITMETILKELSEAAASTSAAAQTTAGASSPKQKTEPVWDPDEDEESSKTGPPGAEAVPAKNGLTDEKRLEILEDRFILGEVSEDAYKELKEKLLKRMGRL
jgi:hypothetical protein